MFDLPEKSFRQFSVEAGGIIFMEGQEADKAYVILHGHAEVIIRNPAGDETVVDRLGPGELFGEIALLREGQKRTATIVALDGCELLEFERSVFDTRIRKADPFVRFVLDHMTRRLVNTTGRYVTGRPVAP